MILALAAIGLVVRPSTDAGRRLLNRARELPVHLTSASDRAELEQLATAVENEAASRPQFPRDMDALCHRWQLVCTTRTAGSELLQQMQKQPALG